MKTRRAALVAVGFVLVGILAVWLQDVVVPYTTPFWGLFDNQLDLDVYRAGAQTVLDGGRLYEAKLLGQMDYTYAPISILLFAPFTWVSFETARIIWTAGIFVALYLVIMLSFKSLGRAASWPLRVIALSLVAVTLLLEPVRTTIWYGQINVFLLLIIVADLARPGHRGVRGVGTGIAAGIKLTPLIFVLYLALLRQWRTLMGVLAGFTVTLVVGFAVLPRESWSYWTGKLFDSDRVGAPQTPGNQSLRGLLANLLHSDAPNGMLWMVLALAALAAGMYAAMLAHRHGQELLAITIVGMTSCAVSPMSWGHHWVWFVPLLVIGVHMLMAPGRRAIDRVVVAAGLIALLLIAFPWRSYLAYPIWFVTKTVPDAYLTGLFFKNGIVWLRVFTYYPYNVVFLTTIVATIVVFRRPAGPPSTVDPELLDSRPAS
ncbi:glycosyltransferase 87 family protein [Gordonia insulae]|uniref:Polyprenol-phosphate-mannose-dependent alpha-(1-2)-phosphatidylinositol mannoside mannosyltransferase n=1 Tax=Gordonia insulae TaxID=2420509 RepID=A0A3G8JQG2_9ACTN|nr:glycosyltransferase 87 family protein [Gordonia insulae]AZG47337.1 Polyprenol-phosphate-mannose-dependent alpha-(1-2)-phosphatidylinositol mannoside mannosyltransferase [Gordonia insulae]